MNDGAPADMRAIAIFSLACAAAEISAEPANVAIVEIAANTNSQCRGQTTIGASVESHVQRADIEVGYNRVESRTH